MRREGLFPALSLLSPALRWVPVAVRRVSPAAVLLPLAAWMVVLPLIVDGCSCGHDFDFHLVSWFEAAAQFRAGTLLPHWAYSPAWNAGEPRFVFYPPLSWTLGALLGMVLPWAAVPVAYTWIALTAAGLGMYRLGRVVGGESAALLAALVYVANPYMLFTAYERAAYAELLAAAWIPLLLAAVLRQRVTVLRVAIAVALLWLTNAPAAVMGCYALALVGVLRMGMVWRREGRGAAIGFAGRLAAGVGLGLGLTAFYVVPAAFERRWVEIAMVMVEGMRYGDNFLFHHTADAAHDEVLRTASWIAVGMLAATAAVLAAGIKGQGKAGRVQGVEDGRAGLDHAGTRDQGSGITNSGLAGLDAHFSNEKTIAKIGRPELFTRREVWVGLAVVAGAIGVLLTPVSAAVWRVAPEMAFLQFPWRLLAVLAAVLCTGIAVLAARVRPRMTTAALLGLLLVAAMSWPAVRTFRQECDPEDTVQARRAVFDARTGTDPTDEYTPKDGDNDALAHTDPPFWLAAEADAAAPRAVAAGAGAAGPAARRFAVEVPAAEMLILNLRAYPAWRVRVNGVVVPARGERADGLIAVPVPAGRDVIEIAYGRTEDETVGMGISGMSVLLLLGMGWRRTVPASGAEPALEKNGTQRMG
jgi:hypothetical protein